MTIRNIWNHHQCNTLVLSEAIFGANLARCQVAQLVGSFPSSGQLAGGAGGRLGSSGSGASSNLGFAFVKIPKGKSVASMTETFPKGWRLGGKQLMSDLLRQSGVISLHFFDNLTNSGACGASPSGIMHWFAPSSLVKKWFGNNRNAELCPATTQEMSDHSYQHLPSFSEQNKLSIKLQKTAVKAASWQSPESVHILCCKGFSLSQVLPKTWPFNQWGAQLCIDWQFCIEYVWQHATNKFINTSQPRASSQATASFSSNTSQ